MSSLLLRRSPAFRMRFRHHFLVASGVPDAASPAQTQPPAPSHHSPVHVGAPPTSGDADLVVAEEAASEDEMWP